jgi:tripartite-type tricarboxylate transporter receptor subunit TctC
MQQGRAAARSSVRWVWSLIGVATSLLASIDARGQSVADFYRGKTINVYIGVNVGGGYDFEARLLARFMKAHIPGNPNLVP